VWKGREVPEVLVSGHHEKVRAWRADQAEKVTRERRPDLWSRYQGLTKPAPEGNNAKV
jgi:tRNA (guanine37-N1)-methyltransferase